MRNARTPTWVASSATPAVLVANNHQRRGLVLFNDSTQVLRLRLGTVASLAVTGVAATDLISTPTAHGFIAGTRVKFPSLTGGAGLAVGTLYYVISTGLTATDFKVSATEGGAAVDLTTALTAGSVITADYSLPVQPGYTYVLDNFSDLPCADDISGYWDAANGRLCITEVV